VNNWRTPTHHVDNQPDYASLTLSPSRVSDPLSISLYPARKKKKSYFFNVILEPCGELEDAQPLFCRSADCTEGYMFIKVFCLNQSAWPKKGEREGENFPIERGRLEVLLRGSGQSIGI
jgi:hypothetical protein